MVTELELAIAKIPKILSKPSWSRTSWLRIYQKATSYPDNPSPVDKEKLDRWLRAEADLLECAQCQEHFAQHLASDRYQRALDSRTQLFQFLFHVHNDVSSRIGRPVLSPIEQTRVVSQLINWPATWIMPTASSPGSTVATSVPQVPWWSLLILGILALAAGTAMGIFVPRGAQRRLK